MVTRKEREKSEHRRLILEAAEAVFAQKDFYDATVQEIAERSEFSVGYIYSLFESKEQVFSELVEMRAAEYMAELEARLSQESDVFAKLRAAIRAKLEFFQRRQQFFLIFARLGAGDRVHGPVFLPESCQRMYQELLQRLAGILEDGMQRGLFIRTDPLRLTLCMEGMTSAVIAHWVYGGGKEPDPGAAELIERVLLEGIMAREE
jgi:AcrR family transcriptional regulator